MIFTTLTLFFFLSIFPGQYWNPIFCADLSDPDVVEAGGEYWLTSSSFNCVPGLQILHSTDLVNWEYAGAAIPAGSPYWEGTLKYPDHGNGVWAPSIRYRKSDGRFYIFWGDPDRGIFQVNAEKPDGNWSEPLCVIPGKGMIDPCPLFDDDGRVFLIHAWAKSRSGFNGILTLRELDPECSGQIGDSSTVFDGNGSGNRTVEGPKFYKHGGFYWIFAPAGGVKDGWQIAARSKSVIGPYEFKRVLEAADADDVASGKAAPTKGPHQGGWVCDASGKSWFLHFEDRYAWGRVLHLQPMNWTEDGWCIIGSDVDGDGVGEPVSSWDKPSAFAHGTDVVHSDSDLPLGWQWHARPDGEWIKNDDAGEYVRLNCRTSSVGWNNLWDTPNLLLEKIIGPVTEMTSKVVFEPSSDGDRAGAVVMGMSYGTLEFLFRDRQISLQRRECVDAPGGDAERVLWSVPLNPDSSSDCTVKSTVFIRIVVRDSVLNRPYASWPPKVECLFYYSLDNETYIQAGPCFTAREGRWIGAKVGWFAVGDAAGGGSLSVSRDAF